MSKTFTCQELGGVCDEKFSGDSLMDVMQKGMQHMSSDEAHKQHTATLERSSGENRQQWMERMQREFDAKPEDQ